MDAKTNLFAAILLAGQFDLAHAACSDSLAQDPFARLGWNYCSRSSMFRCRRTRRISVAMMGTDSGSRSAVAGTRRDSGGGRHFGMLMLVVGSGAASSREPRRFGAP